MKEKVNQELKKYIEENILPIYAKNDPGHNIDHINYVVDRSFKFAATIPHINYDMVYVVATYHDVGHHIDAKNHEKISSEMLLQDKILNNFFTKDEIDIMAGAVYDHRASLETEPRSIYGKIISSADRNIFVDNVLKRTYQYRIKHGNDKNLNNIIEESKNHLIEKFGKKGYAKEKIYFEDPEYKQFLKELENLTKDDDAFRARYIKTNNIDEKQD